MDEQLPCELLRLRHRFRQGVPDREPAAEVQDTWRPVELCAAAQRNVDEPLHCKQALGAAGELRADVNVQTGNVQPRSPRIAHCDDSVVGDEPELRLRVGRLDCAMGLGLDARRHPDQNGFDAGGPGTGRFFERIEGDQRTGFRCGAEFLV